MSKLFHVTHIFKKIGVKPSEYKNGAAGTLKVLNRLGITEFKTITYGRGVTFVITEAEAIRIMKTHAKSNEAEEEKPATYNRTRKDVRSVARALLDLYRRLGEEPHANNRIIEIAERIND